MQKINKDHKIVVVNQATNYLTIGLCNALSKKFKRVALITGSIHAQGEELNEVVNVSCILSIKQNNNVKKILNYIAACIIIYWKIITRYRGYDVLFMSLPPMAYLMSFALPNRCSMLIWDVYPDIFKITGMKETHIIYRIWAKLNKIVFKRAYKLFTIGNKMADLLSNYVKREKIIITPIWSIFQSDKSIEKKDNHFVHRHNLLEKFVVQYSGNIGLTHNVEVMVELAEKMQSKKDILFQIIGRGPRVTHLKELVEKKGLPNCQFLPFQSDEMFPFSLSAADLGVVILDESTSKGSVPSKSYNLMSFGIPSLYIAAVDSELYDYAVKYQHAECFRNNELDSAKEFIERIHDDEELWKQYSNKALEAAKNYRRDNADKIVELYLSE